MVVNAAGKVVSMDPVARAIFGFSPLWPSLTGASPQPNNSGNGATGSSGNGSGAKMDFNGLTIWDLLRRVGEEEMQNETIEGEVTAGYPHSFARAALPCPSDPARHFSLHKRRPTGHLCASSCAWFRRHVLTSQPTISIAVSFGFATLPHPPTPPVSPPSPPPPSVTALAEMLEEPQPAVGIQQGGCPILLEVQLPKGKATGSQADGGEGQGPMVEATVRLLAGTR